MVALALLGPGAGAAVAQDRSVSGAEAADLARRAVDDDAALAELREIREVDERAVDLASATASLGADRGVRLRALAEELDAGGTVGSVDVSGGTAEARRSAERVLDDDKFHERELPQPFRGPLEWLADRFRPVGRFFDRLLSPILDLPGGAAIVAALVIGVGAAGTAALIGRRSRALVARSSAQRLVDPTADPADLDRRADAAAADGDLEGSVRLRYLAGLLRLARADRLVLRPDTTPSGAALQVALPVMDRLTVDFEEIVYGERVPTEADVAASRSGWAEVLGARPAGRLR